jgi:hypothetical protein
MPGRDTVHYLPILTTVVSAAFLAVLIHAARTRRSGPHLVWWAVGVFFYGLGTGLEGTITLFGNTMELTRAWYIAGAILGGYPLAQGVAYLLLDRRVANALTLVTLPLVFALIGLILASPGNPLAIEPHRPSGAFLEWQWIRWLTPIINLYAFVLLVGGALLSALRYARLPDEKHRAWANSWIALGGLLPGLGGSMAKAGWVEALYVGEFVGLLLIWLGYRQIAGRKAGMAKPVLDPE